MKKIRSGLQLQLEQEKLAHRRLMLEEDIRRDWYGLRHSFEPGVFARDSLFSGLSWLSGRLFGLRSRVRNDHRHSAKIK